MLLSFVLFLLFIPIVHAGETGLPYGHPNRCRDLFKVKYADLPTLGELPGEGFDNLVNVPMAAIVELNYTLCKTTDDGHFLIPDSITVVPTKISNMEHTVSYFQHWDDFISINSKSINAEARFRFLFVGISGKFSEEYQTIKTRQYFEKIRTMRMQLRHSRYRVSLVPRTSLHPSFKQALEVIAQHILSGRNELATYESQVLVNLYGTHVITDIELGAALVKTDELSDEMDTKSDSEKHTIQQAAEISFLRGLDSKYTLGFGFTEASFSKAMSQYISLRRSSETVSLGGNIITSKENLSQVWASSVEGNLVALDRMGMPIYSFISKDTLSGMSDFVFQKLTKEIKDAVYSYYQQNVIRGCTDPKSPNFSFEANYNDGMCKAENNTSNYPFGGIYQQCSTSGNDAVCEGIRHPNPLTGSYSCPSGFQPKLINAGNKAKVFQRTHTTRCGLLWLSHCHKTIYYIVNGYYTAYWCYGSPGVSPLLFGGLFTSHHVNFLTQERSCPPEFQTLTILDDMSVCVSQDIEQGRKHSLPFAGFYSCKSGNPFANDKHDCPNGFSQHLATVDDGCEIDYCIKTGALGSLKLPRVQKPPFMDKPVYNETEEFEAVENGTVVELNDASYDPPFVIVVLVLAAIVKLFTYQ